MTKDLRRIESALEKLSRMGRSRRSDAIRCARAGVHLPRAAQQVLRHTVEQGPSRISDLVRATMTDDAAVSRQVTALEREGLVSREGSPEDGRVSMVSATARGRRVQKKLRAAADEIFREHMVDWSARDLSRLAEYLERLAGDLRDTPRASRSVAAKAGATGSV